MTGTVDGESVEFRYDGGALGWSSGGGKESIHDHDIITITPTETPKEFTVHSVSLQRAGDETTVPDVALKQHRISSPPETFLSQHGARELSPHLALPAEDIHVIVSMKSGLEKAGAFYEGVLKPVLAALGLGPDKYQLLETETHQSIQEYTKRAVREKATKGVQQTILLLSGDGGIGDLLNGLGGGEHLSTYTRPNVFMFPFGTGNALFHSLHRPSHRPPSYAVSPLHTALNALFSTEARPLPYFVAKFNSAQLVVDEGRRLVPLQPQHLYGCIVASYGFHATLVADSDTADLRVQGDRRFQMVAADLLRQPHRYRARLTMSRPLRDGGVDVARLRAEGKPVPLQEMIIQRTFHSYILCTMVSNLEKTFTISPASKPFDGRMWLVHFDAAKGNEILQIMKQAYEGGKHIRDSSEFVGYEEVNSIQIDFNEEENEKRWLRVCVDGFVVRVEVGSWMKVVRGTKGREVLNIVF